jgi:hypothetical protein
MPKTTKGKHPARHSAITIPIRVSKGEHVYADHCRVTLNGVEVHDWREADEINRWIITDHDADSIRCLLTGAVVITLADAALSRDAPEDVREAYDLARTPEHLASKTARGYSA